jgi:hypothetical protein
VREIRSFIYCNYFEEEIKQTGRVPIAAKGRLDDAPPDAPGRMRSPRMTPHGEVLLYPETKPWSARVRSALAASIYMAERARSKFNSLSHNQVDRVHLQPHLKA